MISFQPPFVTNRGVTPHLQHPEEQRRDSQAALASDTSLTPRESLATAFGSPFAAQGAKKSGKASLRSTVTRPCCLQIAGFRSTERSLLTHLYVSGMLLQHR